MDGLEFSQRVGRFGADDVSFIVDVLRGAYQIVQATDADSEDALLLGDFIEALDECDMIVLVDDEENLIDAD